MHRLYLHFAGQFFHTARDVEAAGHGAFVDVLESGVDPGLSLFSGVRGPKGDEGTLAVVTEIADLKPTSPPAIAPERQTWISAAPDGAVMIGWETQFKPTPELLCRPRQIEGFYVKLGGGPPWLLPRLDVPPPFTMTRGSLYTPYEQRTSAREIRLNELALRLKQQIRDAGDAWQRSEFPPATRELLDLALARNYRGVPALWDALGLFDDAFLVGAAVLAVTGISAALCKRLAALPQSH